MLLQRPEMAGPGILNTPWLVILEPRENYSDDAGKMLKTGIFFVSGVFFGYFQGCLGEYFLGVQNFRLGGFLFQHFPCQFQIRPSRVSVTGRGILNCGSITEFPKILGVKFPGPFLPGNLLN